MMGGTSRRTAIVADRRPLERGLARFLLEERGLFVVGEAATMADVLLQVQQLRPDIIVLHEKLALDHDPTVIAQIRRVSARTSVVLLAANREALPPELLLLADTVVEDGPGLTELAAAFAGPTPTPSPVRDVDARAGSSEGPALARNPGSRWFDRLQGLAVASVIALAFVIARDMTTPTLVSPVVGRAHLVAAWDSLDELGSALPSATPEQIAEIASVLIEERAAAEVAGMNIVAFDEALVERLAAVWTSLPQETQALLIALFGDIIDVSDVPPPPLPLPSPEPQPNPHPAPEPHPAPTETTSPPPTETTSRRRPRPRARRRPRPRARRHRDHEPAADRDHEPAAHRDHEPAADRDHEPAADRDHEPAADRDHEPAADRDHEPAAHRDHEPAADRDHEPAADRDHDAAADRDHARRPPRPRARRRPRPRPAADDRRDAERGARGHPVRSHPVARDHGVDATSFAHREARSIRPIVSRSSG